MARNAGVVIENNFSGGLVTEYSAMNAPENSLIETENIILDRKGFVTKRKGLKVVGRNLPYKNNAIWETIIGGTRESFYKWEINDETYLIIFGAKERGELYLTMYRISKNLDQFTFVSQIPLRPFYWGLVKEGNLNAFLQAPQIEFNEFKDVLIVTHNYLNAFYITTSGVATLILLRERDLIGVDDPRGDDYETEWPWDSYSTPDARIHYNASNSSWWAASMPDYLNMFTWYGRQLRIYPAQQVVQFQLRNVNKEGQEYSSTYKRMKDHPGNRRAPRGHFILNILDKERNGLGTLGFQHRNTFGIPKVLSPKNFSTATVFSGRVFWSGVNEGEWRGKVYFSRVAEEIKDIGLCYQKGDPTAEAYFDLLADDGGYVLIQNCGEIRKLVPSSRGVYVFSERGVWEISGTVSSPFAANDFSVSQISSSGLLSGLYSGDSICQVGQSVVYMSEQGLMSISLQDNSLTDLSSTKIKSYLSSLTNQQKSFIKIKYLEIEGLLYILIPEKNISPIEGQFIECLIFDLLKQSYYKYSFNKLPDGGIREFLVLDGNLNPSYVQEDIFKSNGEVITTDSLENVTLETITFSNQYSPEPIFFLLMNRPNLNLKSFHMVSMIDTNYIDYDGIQGVPESAKQYRAFFTTPYTIHADMNKKFSIEQLTINGVRSPDKGLVGSKDPSCFFQAIWDYSTSQRTGRETRQQQVYSYNNNVMNSMKKLRVRGAGYGVSFKFSDEPGKPFSLSGWSAYETSNAGI